MANNCIYLFNYYFFFYKYHLKVGKVESRTCFFSIVVLTDTISPCIHLSIVLGTEYGVCFLSFCQWLCHYNTIFTSLSILL